MSPESELVLLGLLLSVPASAGPIFTTLLSPANEVPPVPSLADGLVTLEFNDSLDSVDYRFVLRTITSPLLQAHIHFGTPDINGGIALFLFSHRTHSGDLPAERYRA